MGLGTQRKKDCLLCSSFSLIWLNLPRNTLWELLFWNAVCHALYCTPCAHLLSIHPWFGALRRGVRRAEEGWSTGTAVSRAPSRGEHLAPGSVVMLPVKYNLYERNLWWNVLASYDKFEEVMRVRVTPIVHLWSYYFKKVRRARPYRSLLQHVASVVALSETVGYVCQLFVGPSSVEKGPSGSLSQDGLTNGRRDASNVKIELFD